MKTMEIALTALKYCKNVRGGVFADAKTKFKDHSFSASWIETAKARLDSFAENAIFLHSERPSSPPS